MVIRHSSSASKTWTVANSVENTSSLGELVSWCFEPSQPLGFISGLETNSNPSLSYSAHKRFKTNHNFFYSTVKSSSGMIVTPANISNCSVNAVFRCSRNTPKTSTPVNTWSGETFGSEVTPAKHEQLQCKYGLSVQQQHLDNHQRL